MTPPGQSPVRGGPEEGVTWSAPRQSGPAAAGIENVYMADAKPASVFFWVPDCEFVGVYYGAQDGPATVNLWVWHGIAATFIDSYTVDSFSSGGAPIHVEFDSPITMHYGDRINVDIGPSGLDIAQMNLHFGCDLR